MITILEKGQIKEYAGINFSIVDQKLNKDTWNMIHTIKMEREGQEKYIEWITQHMEKEHVIINDIMMELVRQYNFIKDLNNISIQGIKNMLIDTFELDPKEAEKDAKELFNSYCIVKELFSKDYINMLLDVINGD